MGGKNIQDFFQKSNYKLALRYLKNDITNYKNPVKYYDGTSKRSRAAGHLH